MADWTPTGPTTLAMPSSRPIRAGQHYIDIDMALVEYISSMGIGVLLKYYKQLKAVSGLLRVVNPHENVLGVLKIAKLAELLVRE